MIKDQRLKSNHDLVQDLNNERYHSLFSTHPFPEMNAVIIWLLNQLHKKFKSNETDAKVPFDAVVNEDGLSTIICAGDLFYCSLFQSEAMVSESDSDLLKTNPLARVVIRIYNLIWVINNESEPVVLTIYSELQKYLEQLLGKSTAADTRYQVFSDWFKIYHLTYGLQDFYKVWIESIDEKVIERNMHELLFINPSDQLHDLASFADYRNDKKKASEAYTNNLGALSDKSDWYYIREATGRSDMLMLNDDLSLKENLILRIGIRSWLTWVDNLKWPILQDSAFYSIQDLSIMEEVIALIVKEEPKFKTKSQYLLLIALQDFYDLLEKITTNLYNLKEGEWYHRDKKVKELIVAQYTPHFDKWMTSELEASCTKVFGLIFGSTPISTSKYFTGVFEWINNYSKLSYLDKRDFEPGLKTLEVINQVFENILILDPQSKRKITSEVALEQINWEVFEKLIALFQSNETDIAFRDSLQSKFVEYIESDHFNWNGQLKYNNVVINQAYYFSYLISRAPDSLSIWHRLFSKFKCWHEGWLTVDGYDYKVRRKETYILMVGACIAYSNYSQGKLIEGKKAFEDVLNMVLSQYRVSSSSNSNDYEIVLRLLSHTIAKFSPLEVDDFLEIIDEKSDDIELFLVVAYEITLFIGKASLKLNASSISIIRHQINRNFWKKEIRYQDPVLKYRMDHLSYLKNETLDSLNKL